MTPTQSAKRVFVSYTRQDQDLARDIARRLRSAGLEPWIDLSLSAGENWARRLGGAIRDSDAVIFLLTPAALASEWTVYELGLADAADKVIVPVVAGLGDQPLSPVLKAYQLVPYDRLDAAISELARRLTGAGAGRGSEGAPSRPAGPRADRRRPKES
jgi:hypothetical protein